MDGNMTENDAKLAEVMRQQEVYEKAMKSLNEKRKRREGETLAIMFAADEFGEMLKPGTRLARLANYSVFAIVLLMGLFINYLFWSVALNG